MEVKPIISKLYIFGVKKIFKVHSILRILYNKVILSDVSIWAKISGRNISWGKNLKLYPNSIISTRFGGKISLGNKVTICPYAQLISHGGEIVIGNNVGVQMFSILYGLGGLKIGNDVMIATHTIFVPANHNFNDLNSPMRTQGSSKSGIVVEDDVWIGSNSVILDGVTIGKGSVIGAGSVVTKSIPEYSVAVGNPAKVIKSRK